ncbi:MAG TPA: methyltransferase domain-containing protein [Isosphaeraceae bacterium]|jgi:SAM-dependent methyltransferase
MIVTYSRGAGPEFMPAEILTDLSAAIRRHPWWSARARLTLALLGELGVRPPAPVLDAGCGWGVTLDCLERRGYRVTGLDVARPALERLDRDRPGRTLIEADLTADLPEEAGDFAAVLALDVLEHLDDDRAAAARLARLAAPGGVVIVSVPALPELFSEFDAIQGHRRRYRPETLRAAFVDSGLHVERVFWWGAWMVPLLRRQRRGRRALPGDDPAAAYRRYLALPPWPAPWVLRAAFALEQGPALRGRLRAGTSLFAVARRPT